MKNRKAPSELEIGEWLHEGRLQLPPLRFRLARIEPNYRSGATWDFEVEATWGSQSATFAVEYKSLFTPRAFEDALRRCNAAAGTLPKGRYPLLLMPYLRPSQLEELENQAVSGVDCCGNGVVIVPGKFNVFRTGAPNQFATYTPIKNIYRKNTSMVGRLLLAVTRFSRVQEVRAEINRRNLLVNAIGESPMSLATVSKALKQLEDDLIIDRREGIRLLQGDKLLDQLEQNYEPPSITNRIRLKVDCAFEQLPQFLSQQTKSQNVLLVGTGLSSVSRYATMQREEMLSLYCPSLATGRAIVGGKETERFPNLELIESKVQRLYFDARDESGFYWASPAQAYFELMRGDKRDRETAVQVREYILRREQGGADEWR